MPVGWVDHKGKGILYADYRGLKPEQIDSLARVANLEILITSSNHITDLSPLQEMTQLRWLEGSFNDIENITPLRKLHKLYLHCELPSQLLWAASLKEPRG